MIENTEYTEVRLPSKVYYKIERAVVSLYKKLVITTIPLDPFKIAEQMGFIVKRISELPHASQIELREREREALSLYDNAIGTFVIFYDDSISYSRIRFTLMHEIGHIVLGHKEESELARRMADYFAAYALAPSPLIGKYNCDDYMDVANKFSVSQVCASICFQRYLNWAQFGGNLELYEIELLNLFS